MGRAAGSAMHSTACGQHVVPTRLLTPPAQPTPHFNVLISQFAAVLVADKESEEVAKGRTLLGRLGTPGDMAATVAFLVSDDASYITGETIVVAGGMQSRL